MVITDKYILFWGSIFSNFAHTPYTSFDGINFSCSEQEFMYRKAKLFEDEEIARQILASSNPKIIKALGRKVRGFDAQIWDNVRYDIMYTACYYKFSQNQKAKEALLTYKGKEFVEASPYDKIWGIGLREGDDRAINPLQWKGQNLLGKILTRLSNEL